MLDPQNFSINANDDTEILLDIDPDDGITLVGAQIQWCMYEQFMGLPVPGVDPVVVKNNADGGTITVDDPETQVLKIPLTPSDTVGLLRNYYHEATVNDPERGTITVAFGIVCVLGTENR